MENVRTWWLTRLGAEMPLDRGNNVVVHRQGRSWDELWLRLDHGNGTDFFLAPSLYAQFQDRQEVLGDATAVEDWLVQLMGCGIEIDNLYYLWAGDRGLTPTLAWKPEEAGQAWPDGAELGKHMADFQERCSPEDRDRAYVEADHDLVVLIRDPSEPSRIIAAASAFPFYGSFEYPEDFNGGSRYPVWDLGFLVDPEWRGRGLGLALGSGLRDILSSRGLGAQIRAMDDKPASKAIALGLGFAFFGRLSSPVQDS